MRSDDSKSTRRGRRGATSSWLRWTPSRRWARKPQLCEVTRNGFEKRKEMAATKRDRWQVSLERDICVARLSAAVQRGTAIILLKNAAPLAGYSEFPELVPLDANEGERLWGAAGT